jgi:hypothetical protein
LQSETILVEVVPAETGTGVGPEEIVQNSSDAQPDRDSVLVS